MAVIETVLKWPYEPKDYFEMPFKGDRQTFTFQIADGWFEATLKSPEDPVPDSIRNHAERTMRTLFSAHGLNVHREHTILNLHILQKREDGTTRTDAFISGTAYIKLGDCISLSLVGVGPDGQVIDPRVARAAAHQRFAGEIAAAAEKEPLVSALLQAYTKAILDPADELVHLYEIEDALRLRFGGLNEMLKALSIDRLERSGFGQLANDAPVREGRHRGKHIEHLRSATTRELEDARKYVRKLILHYARFVR